MSALSSAPRMVAQMRSALAQVRSFVPKLETTIQDAMPQIAQASAMLKNLSADFADTGEGGFHLSRKDLADPSYRHVRESMFSSDGTATRLFLYSDGQLDLAAAARAQQLEIAAGKAMKYGSLVDSQVTVGGAAQIAAAVRDALIHDAVLLAVILLTVVALASMWRGAVHGAAVGVGVLASYLAALGVSIALWQHLLDRELNALVPLVSFAVLASCGVPYLVAASKPVVSPTRQRVRGPRGRYPGGERLRRLRRSVAYSALAWCWCREVPSACSVRLARLLCSVWAC